MLSDESYYPRHASISEHFSIPNPDGSERFTFQTFRRDYLGFDASDFERPSIPPVIRDAINRRRSLGG